MTAVPVNEITAIILAGGRSRRMGGIDKGLLPFQGQVLIEPVIAALQHQVGTILISANRNLERYQAFGQPVIADMLGDYYGPLAGIATGMQAVITPYVLAVPCDAPRLPDNLVGTLWQALDTQQADISVAHDGTRLQPLFALLKCTLLPALLSYLDTGGRKVEAWYGQQQKTVADFSSQRDHFINLNTPEDQQALERRLVG
jgi:molybdenum cofactor guanylyltransferase